MKELFKPSLEDSTDMTENGLRVDDLEPELPSAVDNTKSIKADTRKDPTKPATKSKASAIKKQELTKRKPTNSRKQKFEAKVDKVKQGEIEQATH
jgi:hypothetical protein